MNPSDPIGRPKETGALFARLYPHVFSKKDTISLLRALIEFSSLKKTLIVYDRNDEYEFILPRLECFPSKRQVNGKCSNLKRLYVSNLSKGVTAGGMTGDNAVIFELSEKLWGEEVIRLAKEKERERSARSVNLDVLIAGLEEGKSLGMVSGKGGKRKREDEPGKIGGMAENGSGHEVLDDEDGEFAGSAELSAEPGSEDGELARKVPRKKDKKHKREDDSAKRQRSRENGPGSEMSDKESSKLAKAEDSRAKSGLEDGGSTSYELKNKKKHKRVKRSREFENLSKRGSANEDDGSRKMAEQSTDSLLDKGKSSRKKKKHKGDKADDFKRLSESGSADEALSDIGKSTKSTKLRAKSWSEKMKKLEGDEKSRKLGNSSERRSGDEKSNAEDDRSDKSSKGSVSLKRKKKKTQGRS